MGEPARRWPERVAIVLAALAAALVAAPTAAAPPDRTPPELRVSLEWIPRGQSQLLVVPPGGFHITLGFDAGSGSPVDRNSLSVICDREIAGTPAGGELAGNFRVQADGAVWRVPAGANLARSTHTLHATIRDRAGNRAHVHYRFAVRGFAFGAPLGVHQLIHLDFSRRSGADRPDFRQVLRRLGLDSSGPPWLRRHVRAELEDEIVARVRTLYGLHPDGTPAGDAVNVAFTARKPDAPFARVCIGGTHPGDPKILGSVPIDLDNLEELRDECESPAQGVFPDALMALWGDTGLFRRTFNPLMPDRGGTPLGVHPLDRVVLTPGFRLEQANTAQRRRLLVVLDALDVFAQAVAVATAHEVGHMLGLTAPGPAPRGLFGGARGALANHNVTADGGPAPGNFVMNYGGSFSLASIAGREGHPLPRFRPVNRAYLRNRIVRNENVTGLLPPPTLSAVQPARVVLAGTSVARVKLRGSGFTERVSVELVERRSGRIYPLIQVVRLDAETLRGDVSPALVPSGTYDVRVISSDEQEGVLPGALTVRLAPR